MLLDFCGKKNKTQSIFSIDRNNGTIENEAEKTIKYLNTLFLKSPYLIFSGYSTCQNATFLLESNATAVDKNQREKSATIEIEHIFEETSRQLAFNAPPVLRNFSTTDEKPHIL